MSETITRREKLYRMMMTVYDEHGDPFWGVLHELASINHWYDDTFASTSPADKAEKVLLETVPEAQALMRELLRRGLVYIKRVYGWPPPTTGTSKIMDEEVEAVISDTQNWLGPLDEGPSVIYYCFCSPIPGETITRETIAW